MKELKIWKNILSQEDKVKHLLANFIIVLILGVLFSPTVGVATALVASLCKEIYDEYKEDGSGWSWQDIVADLIGIVLGILIVL